MSSIARRGRAALAARRAAPLAALLITSFLGVGCSWGLKSRPVRPGEQLRLESALVPAPSGDGWRAARESGDHLLLFALDRAGPNGVADRSLEIAETDSSGAPLSREAMLAELVEDARKRLGDPAAGVEVLPVTVPSRLGGEAIAVGVRATESDARAGLARNKVVESVRLAFVPATAPQRRVTITFAGTGTSAEPPGIAEATERLAEGIEVRPVDRAAVEDAAREDGFPKHFETALARRSLTLPRHGFQWQLARERWISPEGFTGGWGLSFGLTDHLELSTPGYLRYAFGEAEARTRAEFSIGGGLTRLEHDPDRGDLWGLGLSLAARRRLGSAVALRAGLLGESVQESRTGRSQLGGAAAAGVVYDLNPFLSLGLEGGYQSRPWSRESRSLAWIGGRSAPLVTVHVPLLDVGLLGAAAWDQGKPGVLVGFSTLVTF